MNFTRRAGFGGAVVRLAVAAVPFVVAPANAEVPNSSPAVSPEFRCASLIRLKIPGSSIEIVKAEEMPDAAPGTVRVRAEAPDTVSVTIPAHCRADGVIDQRLGVDNKPYAIGFAIALPERWNGRFLFQGGGGLNGSVRPPLGMQAAGDVHYHARAGAGARP